MAEGIKTYKEYIYKDGQFRKVIDGGADVQIVDELPTTGVENTIYVLDGSDPGPSPTKKSNKMQVRVIPYYGSKSSKRSGLSKWGRIFWNTTNTPTTVSDFLAFPIFGSKTDGLFNFNTHNYYYAYNSGRRGKRTAFLSRQNKYSPRISLEHCYNERIKINSMSNEDYIKLRKRYSSKIVSSPTWGDLLYEILGHTFVDNIIDKNNNSEHSIIRVSECNSNTESVPYKRNYLKVHIAIPLLYYDCVEIPTNIFNNFLNETNLHFSAFFDSVLVTKKTKNLNANCKLAIVKDVTVIGLENHTQYIPTDIVSYFNMTKFYIKKGYLHITISSNPGENTFNNFSNDLF